MSSVVVVVDGDEHPVDLVSLTAEQVSLLRLLGVTSESLAVVVAQEESGTAVLPEIVALVALSLTQQDRPCDIAWLARHITSDSDVEVRSEIDDEEPPSPEVVAAARAILDRAAAT